VKKNCIEQLPLVVVMKPSQRGSHTATLCFFRCLRYLENKLQHLKVNKLVLDFNVAFVNVRMHRPKLTIEKGEGT
jgi:hypothetical protein